MGAHSRFQVSSKRGITSQNISRTWGKWEIPETRDLGSLGNMIGERSFTVTLCEVCLYLAETTC